MSPETLRIKCPKCGTPAAPDSIKCLQCGARITKACEECGFLNSAAKKFCDSCGSPQKPLGAAGPAAAPKPAAQEHPSLSPSSADLVLPRTKIISVPEEAAKSPSAPAAGGALAREPDYTDLASPPTSRTKIAPLLSTGASIFLLMLGALLYALHWQHRRAPKTLLIQSAQRYLSALQNHDYEAAYPMLASSSRRDCTLEEFKKSQDEDDWSFSAVDAEDFTTDRALVRYTLRARGTDVPRNWMRFVREDGRWTRAYWWNLSGKFEDALASGNLAAATSAAEAAARIDPYDPLARSYLCEAFHAQGDIREAERNCLQTLELAAQFPSHLGDTGLFHIHAILGDIYKNGLRRYPEAVGHFNIMLALPGLEPDRQCDVTLARAEARYLMRDQGQSLSDLQQAEKACSNPDDLEFIRRSMRVLQGQAGADAVAAVKYQRIPNGNSTYADWRRDSAVKDSWVPEYLGGAAYRVSLREGSREVLTAQVDLWSRTVKVDTYVQ